METQGKLIEIFDVEQISDRFKKREFVIEIADNPQYPELIKFEAVQAKTEILNNFSVGRVVRVFFDLKGRKWTNKNGEVKYFTTLQAWKLLEPGRDGGGDPGPDEEPPPYDEYNRPYFSEVDRYRSRAAAGLLPSTAC